MATDVRPNEGATSSRPVTRFLVDIVLGLVCGALAGLWVLLQAKVARWLKSLRDMKSAPDAGKKKQPMWKTNCLCKCLVNNMDLVQVILLTVVNTTLTVHLPLLGVKSQPVLLTQLFGRALMEDVGSWTSFGMGPLATMFLCFLVKAVVTNFATALPVATGVVAPVMIIGALLGRCYGLLLHMVGGEWFYNFLLSTPGNEELVTADERHALMARFAIVGAAAFSTGVCRAFAMAITVYEVLALPNTLLPLCSSCLAAGFVANLITHPFFDNNLIGRGWAGIVRLTYSSHTEQCAENIMRHIVDDTYCLQDLTTLEEIDKLLNKDYHDNLPKPEHFAIARNLKKEERVDIHSILVGSISVEALNAIKKNLEKADYPRTKEINLMDANYVVAGTEHPHITLNPANVSPSTIARDIYIIMKANDTDVVYVVNDEHHCCGIIEQRTLLGHDL